MQKLATNDISHPSHLHSHTYTHQPTCEHLFIFLVCLFCISFAQSLKHSGWTIPVCIGLEYLSKPHVYIVCVSSQNTGKIDLITLFLCIQVFFLSRAPLPPTLPPPLLLLFVLYLLLLLCTFFAVRNVSLIHTHFFLSISRSLSQYVSVCDVVYVYVNERLFSFFSISFLFWFEPVCDLHSKNDKNICVYISNETQTDTHTDG